MPMLLTMLFTKMSPLPPASLPISALTPILRLYFERAFSKEGEKLGFRPSPQDWITALTELSSKLKTVFGKPIASFHYRSEQLPLVRY